MEERTDKERRKLKKKKKKKKNTAGQTKRELVRRERRSGARVKALFDKQETTEDGEELNKTIVDERKDSKQQEVRHAGKERDRGLRNE